MEILDVIIDNHGLIYKVQTQNGHVFEHTLAKDTPQIRLLKCYGY